MSTQFSGFDSDGNYEVITATLLPADSDPASSWSASINPYAAIAVIGRNADTASWLNQGYNVLNVPQSEWTTQMNFEWINEIASSGEPTIIASDLTEANLIAANPAAQGLFMDGFTVFGDELGVLSASGFELTITASEAGELLLMLLLL